MIIQPEVPRRSGLAARTALGTLRPMALEGLLTASGRSSPERLPRPFLATSLPRR
jgi:hypothetical protein